MTLVTVLIAASIEIGLSFPSGGLEREVNVGKYLTVSHRVVSVYKVGISPYVRVTRYPVITGKLPIYDLGTGIMALIETKLKGFSGAFGAGYGFLKEIKDIPRLELYPIVRKDLSQEPSVKLIFSVPLLFFSNTVLFNVNVGFMLSI